MRRNRQSIKQVFNTQDAENKRKKKRRPPAKPFDPEAIKLIGGDITSDGDFSLFEGNRYSHKGFLYKTFPINALLTDGVTPTLAELEKFGEVPVEGLELDVQAKADERHNFATGDNVQVCEGELTNLEGKVLAIDGNKITIQPKHEDLKVTDTGFDFRFQSIAC